MSVELTLKAPEVSTRPPADHASPPIDAEDAAAADIDGIPAPVEPIGGNGGSLGNETRPSMSDVAMFFF